MKFNYRQLVILVLIAAFCPLSAEARPETKVISEPLFTVDLPVNPNTLSCKRDPNPTNHRDIITLKIPPMSRVAVFSHGLILAGALDLFYDQGCNETLMLQKARELGGVFKATIHLSTTINWDGGMGIPCQRVIIKSVSIPLSPIIDDEVYFGRTVDIKTYPNQICD